MNGLPQLRVAFEATGSPGWLMRLIQRRGLDRARGFALSVLWLDDRMRHALGATEAALFEGRADLIDGDWLSLADHRRAGRDLVAIHPYGLILGGLVAAPDSAIRQPGDLPGRRLGVVHAGDKNWILLRALLRPAFGVDHTAVELVETGSKTLLRRRLIGREIDAALLYWHQLPEAVERHGCRLVAELPQLIGAQLGEPPATTYFFGRRAFVDTHPELCQRFCAACRDAVRLLREEAAAWDEAGIAADQGGDRALREALRARWAVRIRDRWDAASLVRLAELSAWLTATTAAAGIGRDAFESMFDRRFLHPAVAPDRPQSAGVV